MHRVGMQREEPDQLRADVARGAHDRDADRVAAARARARSRTVRRDRRAVRVRAHGRAGPLAGGRLEGSEIGRNVVTE